jgi:hypothetical protein
MPRKAATKPPSVKPDPTAALRPRLLAIMRAHPPHQEWTVAELREHGRLPSWQPVRTALTQLTEQGQLLISVHSTGPARYTYSLVTDNPPMSMNTTQAPDGVPDPPR